MLIGITGFVGSGKGVTSDFFKMKGFTVISLSDFLREECSLRGQEINRNTLTDIANEWRTLHGPNHLSKKALERLNNKELAVVDSIRNPAEVEELRKRPDFVLLAVDASQEVRFERVKARNRENEIKTFDEFKRFDFSEARSPDPNGKRILSCIEVADIIIKNEKSLQDLYDKLEEIIGPYIVQTKTPNVPQQK